MKNRTGWCLSAALAIAAALVPSAAPQTISKTATASPTQVAVICTLHQFHEETPGYSYADLKTVIERLHPDILAVELTPTDLRDRKAQKIKREYQNAVYPLLEQQKLPTVPMEPEGEISRKLIAAIREAEGSLEREFPQKAETAEVYSDTLFSYLRTRWHSPADVNSVWTDDSFAIKHAFQEKLYGPKEVEGWEGWNRYFLDRIMEAAKANPGKRIVVTVGAEHGYWLREHLRQQKEVNLLDTAKSLEASGN